MEEERTTVEQPPEEEETNNGALTTPAREPPKSTSPEPIDERWEDGTTVEEATVNASAPGTDGFGVAQEELTVDEPPKPAVLARLVVIAGNDTGREFVLAPGKPLTIGRATDNDIVLTDIAVSRKHLDLVWEVSWILKDRGSGNGTLLNDRLEDGQCKLQHGDRIEIGHTVFRFDHVGAAGMGPELGWGTQNDDEASTVAGRSPPRAASPPKPPPPGPTQPPTTRRAKTGSLPPPLPSDRAKASLPPPRPGTPSQGALSARLALPANPTATEAAVSGEPSFLVAAGLTTGSPATPSDSLSASMRSMTATAHVEPLSYSSGTLAPVPVYAHLGQSRSMRRPLAIGVAIMAVVALIGVVAKLTTSDQQPRAGDSVASVQDGTTVTAVAGDGDGDADPTEGSAEGSAEGSVDDAPNPVDDAPDPVDDAPDPVDDAPDDPPPPVVKDPPPPVAKDPPIVKTPVIVVKTPVIKDKPKVVKDKSKVVKNKPKVVKADKGGAEVAKKKAQTLYAAKDFKGAASAVRDAAASAAEADVAELEKLASSYSTLASNMATGNASAASKPTEALTAFKKALAADKKLGGTHAAMIREKLGAVAPKAAAGFMAKGNYEAAKQAADTAVNFGNGSSATVSQVRDSLERKAGELYASGKKLVDSKPDDAKALFRRVLKIVPADSGWYTKAYKALNTRPQTKDDDE